MPVACRRALYILPVSTPLLGACQAALRCFSAKPSRPRALGRRALRRADLDPNGLGGRRPHDRQEVLPARPRRRRRQRELERSARTGNDAFRDDSDACEPDEEMLPGHEAGAADERARLEPDEPHMRRNWSGRGARAGSREGEDCGRDGQAPHDRSMPTGRPNQAARGRFCRSVTSKAASAARHRGRGSLRRARAAAGRCPSRALPASARTRATTAG